ncbi:MAG TPA: glycosyltransferase family 4 protein [Tepidisphaeraceae bacterium]|jgi:glycosyltransferase involved in cell wall biosynthesis
MPNPNRHPLLYILHSSKLYGTERVALDTALGLADDFEPILFGPPGVAMEEAEKLGFEARRFRGAKQFAKVLRPCLAQYPSFTFVSTGVMHSAVCMMLNVLYRRRIRHFHIVHGGSNDMDSYGRKKWLNHTGVRIIAVSEWVKQKLISYEVRGDLIDVVPNSLPEARVNGCPGRGSFDGPGVRKAIVVSRLDPMKRVGTLLDALDKGPRELADISFNVFGLGPEMDPLADRASRTHPNVRFAGFSGDIPNQMAAADLLVHTSPEEPFGLVVLEAMAANLPVLVPDAAGPGGIVEDGVNGFKFRPGDSAHLAERLSELRNAPAERLNSVVAGGRRTVEETYSSRKMLDRYRELFSRG